jgi:hypothetical protein
VIAAEERASASSGMISTFYNLRFLVPTVFIYTAASLIRYGCINFIESELGIDSSLNPIMHQAGCILTIGLECLVVTPLELARKRIMAQPINAFRRDTEATASKLDTCIEVSRQPYTGVLNCIGSVASEEGGRLPKKKVASQDWEAVYGGGTQPKSTFGVGISSLYRGFWTRYAVALIDHYSPKLNQELLF